MKKLINYVPHKKIISAYASVLVNHALGGGKGIKKNDVVYVQFDAPAYLLAYEVYKVILQKGGHPIVRMNEERFQKILYEHGQDFQLDFFPKRYMKSLVSTIDHRMYLIAERNPYLLKHIPPEKIMKGQEGKELMRKWLFEKEDKGKLTWTLALYGTRGMAKEAGLSLEEFWNQIIKACFLDNEDPIQKWQNVSADLEAIREKLNKLPIDSLRITARNTDLTIKLGEKRKWVGGGGRNIPSFEIFTSPDWRGTNGYIYYNYPLYRYGNIIKDIRLEFKDGYVVKAEAQKNEKLLKELVKQRNADKIGEFSLTDARYSHIDKFMANTLYDENFGGKWGNTHIALGTSYHETYAGGNKKMNDEDWSELGFNESPEHTDIIATTNRKVEAIMRNGSRKVIYAGGKFRLPESE